MKNQFNISLGSFDIENEGFNNQNPTIQSKMSLKYVKPSIIESLFQEMDMLSCWLYLNDVCSKSPAVPLDENIHWTISQFTPRTSGIQNTMNEYLMDNDMMNKNSQYYHNDVVPPNVSQQNRFPEFKIEDSNGFNYYQARDYRKNIDSLSNTTQTLNYTSCQLNQELRRQPDGVYNYQRGDSQSFYKSRTKYLPQEFSQQS